MRQLPRRWSVVAAVSSTIALIAIALFVFGPFVLLGMSLGLIGMIALYKFPVLGVYVLVMLLPFNGLITQFLEGSTTATAFGAVKDAILVVLTITALVTGRLKKVPRAILVLVVLIVGTSMISGVFTPTFTQAVYGWRNDYQPLLLLLAIPALVQPSSLRKILSFFVLVGQLAAVVSLVTWNRGVDWLLDIGLLPVEEQADFPTALFSAGSIEPRAFSPFVGPNELAVVMSLVLGVVWLHPGFRFWRRLSLSALPAIVVLLSESRSGIIGAVVVLCVVAARAIHSRSPLLTGAFLTIASAGVLTGVGLYITNQLGDNGDPSVNGHSVSLEQGLRDLAQHPFGLGLGVVGPRAEQFGDNAYKVESFWLLVALEAGIAVLLLYVALLFALGVKTAKGGSALAFVGTMALAGTLVSQLVLPTLQEGAVSYLLWILVGLGLVGASAPPGLEGTSGDVGSKPERRVALRTWH
jgi:hypothetical protein